MPILGITASQNYPRSFSVDFLVLAGGGAGGGSATGSYVGAGGGGAGGLRSSVTSTGGGGTNEGSIAITGGTYTVTVGAGGSAVSGATGGNGSNSVFSTIGTNAADESCNSMVTASFMLMETLD